MHNLLKHVTGMVCPTCENNDGLYVADASMDKWGCQECKLVANSERFGLYDYNGYKSTVSKHVAWLTWVIQMWKDANEGDYLAWVDHVKQLALELTEPDAEIAKQWFIDYFHGRNPDIDSIVRETTEKILCGHERDINNESKKFVYTRNLSDIVETIQDASDQLGFNVDFEDFEDFDAIRDVFQNEHSLTFDNQNLWLDKIIENGELWNATGYLAFILHNVDFSELSDAWQEQWLESVDNLLKDDDHDDLLDVLVALAHGSDFTGLEKSDMLASKIIVDFAAKLPHGSGINDHWLGDVVTDDMGDTIGYDFANHFHVMSIGSYVGWLPFSVRLVGDVEDVKTAVESCKIVWTGTKEENMDTCLSASFYPEFDDTQTFDQWVDGLSNEEKQDIVQDYLSTLEDYMLQNIV